MRIALYHHSVVGGTKRHLYEIAKQMKKEGHTLGFFRPSTDCESFLPIRDYVDIDRIYPNKPFIPITNRLPLIRKYADLIRFKLYLDHMKEISRKIAADIDSMDFDFVFSLHCQPVQSPYLLRYLKTPSVYYCAEPMRSLYEKQSPNFPTGKGASLLEQMSRIWYGTSELIDRQFVKGNAIENTKRASLVLTNSRYSSECIYRTYGIRAEVCYLGVDENLFCPQGLQGQVLKGKTDLSLKENAILTVGRLSPFKGQDFLIQSLGLIPQELRPSLYIATDSCDDYSRNYLSQLAEASGVKIEFLINISDHMLVSIYNRVKAFVFAPVREPFGLVILEAMACGTPVICVREGGAQEFVKDGYNGFIPLREPRAFAKAIEFVLNNQEAAQKVGMNARSEILENWTWKHAYQRMMKCVRNLFQIKSLSPAA